MFYVYEGRVAKTKTDIVVMICKQCFGEDVFKLDSGFMQWTWFSICDELEHFLATDPFDDVPCPRKMYGLTEKDVIAGVDAFTRWVEEGCW